MRTKDITNGSIIYLKLTKAVIFVSWMEHFGLQIAENLRVLGVD